MDEEILEAFERAARIYVAKLGLDPDVRVPSPEETLIGVPKLIPQWHFAVPELHNLSLMLTSMREAATPPTDGVH